MQPESDDSDDDWAHLETIREFDVLTETFVANSDVSSNLMSGGATMVDGFAAKATTPVSLLVESLVQELCALLEKDKTRSKSLYDAICDQLQKMNLIDETWGMSEFEAMRSQYQRALYQLVSVARGQDLPAALEWPIRKNDLGLDWSRYHREFEEIAYIAGGGFGKVYQARNRLDGIVYAVKKVTIKARTINKVLSHLAEVKTLACLNHINIVPYKAAWLEPLLAPSKESEELEFKDITEEDSSDESEEDDRKETENQISMTEEKSSEFIEFEQKSSMNGDQEWSSVDMSTTRVTHLTRAVCHYDTKKSLSDFQIMETQPHLKLKWAILYIQMSLCQLTLREWLDERNKNFGHFEDFHKKFLEESKSRNYSINRQSSAEEMSSEELNPAWTHLKVVSDIFSQIVNGLNYIHARGIIHHDIKPSNIFVGVENGKNLIIQLGDFGLACPLQSSHASAVFGTPQYAAPEQLQGHCNTKSDIYSLGIILLELLVPLSTEMERGKTIENLRREIFPEEHVNGHYRTLLKRLIAHNHDHRPDSYELMELVGKIRNRESTIEDLQQRLSLQDQEIATLKHQVEEQEQDKTVQVNMQGEIERKNEEIQALRSRLSTLREKDKEIKRLKKMLYRKPK